MKNSKRERTDQSKKPAKYAPKVAIPLSFEKAIEGLIAVQPERTDTDKPKKGKK